MSTYLVSSTRNYFCQGLHIRRFQFLHLQKWLWEIHSNAMVLSSAPSDKFPTILQAQEECSLTIELELLNLTGMRWASHACTLLPMLELFEQLECHGTSQMTWHHLKCRLIWWPQPGTISARDSTSDAFNFCISRSGCGRYIATQWFWAALHLINLPPTSKGRPNPTNLVCSGYRTSAFATTWRMLRTRCPSMRECLHRGCVPILHECIPWPHRADVPSEMVMVYLARLFQVPSSTASEPWTCSNLSERPWSLFKNPKQVQLSRV